MDKESSLCQLSPLFDLLGKKRIMHIIKIIEQGTYRFNDIKFSLWDISSNILSQRLVDLEDNNIIIKIITDRPLKIEYHLSEKWKKIGKILHTLTKII